MQISKWIGLFALLTVGAASAWQARPAIPVSPATAKQTPRAKTSPPVPDSHLEALIRGKFAKSKISMNHFTVRVQGGVATLEGKTDVIQHKGTATRLAKSAGATLVNNRIEVSEAGRAKATKNLQEGRRRAQVKRGESR